MSHYDRSSFKLSALALVLSAALLILTRPPAQAAPAADPYDPNELSYGLYWFGLGGANQKFAPGETNPYFDPAKPTLIFVHGWQPFISNELPDFDFDGTDTAAGWINAGWNVGIFVWNQFSDETTGVTGAWFGDGPPPQGVLDAEAKIWSVNGPRGMRWRDWNDNDPLPIPDGYKPAPPGTPSAGELFYQTYIAALEGYTGTIRIAGHSLGNQMAVRLTKLVDEHITAGDIPAALRPARVALLDPYWSPNPRHDIPDGDAAGQKTGDVVRGYIAELTAHSDTLFEWYRSSTWTTPPQGDANDALRPLIFYAEMDPAYDPDGLDKHLAAQHLYFWSYAFDGPDPCTGDGCLGMTRVLSKMSDQQLADVMDADCYWTQDGGQSTKTPQDDTYHSVCASECISLTNAAIEGPPGNPAAIYVNTPYTFTAVTLPTTATAPISYTWTPTPTSGQGADSAVYTWATTGTQTITLTAENCGGPVTATRIITVEALPPDCPRPLTGVVITGPTTGVIETPYVFTATVTPPDATTPLTYTWTPLPAGSLLLPGRSVATYTWSAAGHHTITVTVENCGGRETDTYSIHISEPRRIYLPLILRN